MLFSLLDIIWSCISQNFSINYCLAYNKMYYPCYSCSAIRQHVTLDGLLFQAKVSKTNSSNHSVSSHRSSNRHKCVKGEGSVPFTSDNASSRHGNGTQRHRTPSKSSIDSQRSHHHHNSRNRQSSQSRYSNHSYSLPEGISSPEPTPQKRTCNQAAFQHCAAPLAQGETTGYVQ